MLVVRGLCKTKSFVLRCLYEREKSLGRALFVLSFGAQVPGQVQGIKLSKMLKNCIHVLGRINEVSSHDFFVGRWRNFDC
eukprot:3927867-Pyramimonas_sp.AAC.1